MGALKMNLKLKQHGAPFNAAVGFAGQVAASADAGEGEAAAMSAGSGSSGAVPVVPAHPRGSAPVPSVRRQ